MLDKYTGCLGESAGTAVFLTGQESQGIINSSKIPANLCSYVENVYIYIFFFFLGGRL